MYVYARAHKQPPADKHTQMYDRTHTNISLLVLIAFNHSLIQSVPDLGALEGWYSLKELLCTEFII